MRYEHVDFNSAWAAKKSLAEFMEHEKHHGLSDAQMKDAHALCKAENKSQYADPKEVSNEKPKIESAGY